MTTMGYAQSGELDDLIALSAERAVALAKISMRRLRYWELRSLVQPSIRRRVGTRSTVRLYTFDDLVALLVTAQMRRRGFSLQHIRRVVHHLRSRGYERPLTQLIFATAPREIYFRHPDGSWEGDIAPDQAVLWEVIDLELIRTIIRKAVGRPPEMAGKLDSRPGRLGGKPVFAGTRIPVETVTRRLNHGFTAAQVLEAYPDLTTADIELARTGVASR